MDDAVEGRQSWEEGEGAAQSRWVDCVGVEDLFSAVVIATPTAVGAVAGGGCGDAPCEGSGCGVGRPY